MPIPAGPGGQREAWRGPGAAAGLFWRPVTLAQIPPRPQECRSLPSPRACTPPRPPRQSPSGEAERASEPASEAGAGAGADGAAACLSRPRTRRAAGRSAKCTRGWARAARGRGWAGAGRRRAGAGRPISTRALLHTHSQLTRGRGDKDTHGAQETKARSRRPRGAVLEAEGGAGPGGSHRNRHRGCRRAEGGAPAH